MRAISLLGVVIWISFTACNSSTEVQNQQNTELNFVIVDSLKVPYIGSMALMAVSPSEQKLLMLDWQRRDYIVADARTGQIISTFNKEGDRPDNPGYGLRAPSFLNDQSILVVGHKGAFEFTLDGDLSYSVPFSKPFSSGIFFMSGGSSAPKINFQSDEYYLLPGLLPEVGNKTERKFYDAWRSLTLFNRESGSLESFIPLQATSRFFDGMAYEIGHLMPVYTIAENRIWITHYGEPVIRIFDLEAGLENPVAEFTHEILNYQESPGEEPSKAEINTVSFNSSIGGIKSIQAYGQHIVVVSFSGFTKAQKTAMEDAWNSDPEAGEELYRLFLSQLPLQLDMYSKEGQWLGRTFAPNMIDVSEMVAGKDHLWVQRKPNDESEEDFIMIYKVRIDR